MKKPNFFIIGAPKCGTTSVAGWLQEHPAIFISDPKEPGYFDDNLGEIASYSLVSYERLFLSAKDSHIAVGEGSTGYMRSTVAIKNILEYARDARFIVCLRNPVEMALSLHGQRLREGVENIDDFEIAWRAQELRRRGQCIPKLCMNPSWLLYGEICRIGEQLVQLLKLVPRERVYIAMLDDLRASPDVIYREILAFLGVPDDARREFPVSNQACHVPRWLSAARNTVWNVKARCGIYAGLRLLNDGGLLQRIFGRKDRPHIPSALRAELIEHFKPDISMLELILRRDFSHWYRAPIENSGSLYVSSRL